MDISHPHLPTIHKHNLAYQHTCMYEVKVVRDKSIRMLHANDELNILSPRDIFAIKHNILVCEWSLAEDNYQLYTAMNMNDALRQGWKLFGTLINKCNPWLEDEYKDWEQKAVEKDHESLSHLSVV